MYLIDLIGKAIKSVMPSPVRRVIKNSKLYISLRKNFRKIVYAHYVNRINRRIDPSKPVEVAVFTSSATNWNSFASMYSLINKRHDINITVYLYPALEPRKNNALDLDKYHDASDYFLKRRINFISMYDTLSEKWIDASSVHADYIFYDRPYFTEPPEFLPSEMYRRSKVCYIPYGFILTNNADLLHIVLSEHFMRYCYTFFASWYYVADYADKLYDSIGHRHHHVARLGYPRFDLHVKTAQAHKKFTVLWNPRFAVKNKNSKIPASENTFFDFWQEIIPRVNIYHDEYWIIRPHPLAFIEYKRYNLITQEELDEYTASIDKNPGTELDKEKDYLVAFDRSDVMLADFSSIVIEYAALGKPIIYCGNPEAIPIPEMLECMYLANSWDKAVYYLDELKKGNDPLAEKRRIFMNMIASDGKSGEKIVEYILDDYRKSAGGNNHNA